jgi:hypothetical protein
MWTRTRLLRFHATDSSDPLTSLRFGNRSKRRKRQKLLIRIDHSSSRSKSPCPNVLTEKMDAEIAGNHQHNDDHTDDGEDAHAALISLRTW